MVEKTKATKAKSTKKAEKKTSQTQKDVTKASPPIRRRLFWYASVALVATVVVYGVQYQDMNAEPSVEKPIVSRTKTTQISMVSDPGVVVSNAAEVERTPPVATDLSRLRSVQSLMKVMTGLEGRLTEIEALLENISQKGSTAGITKENLAFSEMVSELRDNYQRGDVLLEQITQLQLFSRDVMQDIAMADALEILLSVTPTEGPITLAELSMMAAKTQIRGLPTMADMVAKPTTGQEEDKSFIERVKAWLSSLIQVRKVESRKAYDLAQPWVLEMEQLQIYLLRGRADAAQTFILEAENLGNDRRLVKLSHTLDLYLRQQQALQSVLNAYTG